MNSLPRFIVLEGLDGAGTTTQTNLLASALRSRGHSVLTTREPTEGPIGAVIRQFLTGRVSLNVTSVALAFAADRLDHLEQTIKPAIENGVIVLSDRYVLSSLAYQGIDLDPPWVAAINSHAPRPALTIFLDIEFEDAFTRMRERGSPAEYYEQADRLRRVVRSYRRAVDSERLAGQRVDTIDGRLAIREVHSAVLERVLGLLA